MLIATQPRWGMLLVSRGLDTVSAVPLFKGPAPTRREALTEAHSINGSP